MAKKYLDNDGLLYFWQKVVNKFISKDGLKVLSDNNYTTEEKIKLSGIEVGAEFNEIDSIKVNDTSQIITNKTFDITFSTKVSDLTKDEGFISDYTETDPVFSARDAADITSSDISSWNAKAEVSDIPTKNNQLTNEAGYQTVSKFETAIDIKISSAYKIKRSIGFASLPSATSSKEGFVYNIIDSFTATDDFVEGAGNIYPAGTNVVIVNTGSNNYKYDMLACFVDLSGYALSSDLVAIFNKDEGKLRKI